jgi:enamine deaminase RidA (YjgF/YER057c/UK114 family)
MYDPQLQGTMRSLHHTTELTEACVTIERINSPGLAPVPGATHITVATGARIIHIAGQTGVDRTGAPVGGSHGEQAAQALRNLRIAVGAANATLEDVVRLTIYVVDLVPEVFESIVGAAIEVLGQDYPVTAATLVGVAALWQPGLVIEIDAMLVAG